MKVIAQEQTRTTTVRTAVARLDGVCRIPALARIAVRPAKTAAPTAKRSHTLPTLALLFADRHGVGTTRRDIAISDW
jgi:hypothetical protein